MQSLAIQQLDAKPLATNKPWAMPATWVEGQFHHLDRFVVVGVNSKIAIESHSSPGKAGQAAAMLNEHNERYNHEERFEVHPLPAELHNQPPRLWG